MGAQAIFSTISSLVLPLSSSSSSIQQMFTSCGLLLFASCVVLITATSTCQGRDNSCLAVTAGGSALLQTAKSFQEAANRVDPSNDEAAIEFATDVHQDGTTNHDLFTNISTDQTFYYYGRPEWQKTLRCTSEDPDSCTECNDLTDCWTLKTGEDNSDGDDVRYMYSPLATYRTVDLTRGSEYTKFVTLIHVHCVATTLKLQMQVLVTMGTLRLFFDGAELTAENAGAPFLGNMVEASPIEAPMDTDGVGMISLILPLTRKDAHEFRMEYSPSESDAEVGGLGVKVGGLRFFMDNDFMECEDSRTCLQVLAEAGPEGLHMRQDNQEQMRCLQAESVATPCSSGDVCCLWRECLEANDGQHGSRILTFLRAAGVSTGEGGGGEERKEEGEVEGEEEEENVTGEGMSSKEGGRKNGKGGKGRSSKEKGGEEREGEEEENKNGEGASSAASWSQSAESTSFEVVVGGGSKEEPLPTSPQCMNPPTEDPESWECDCYDSIEAACIAIADTSGWTIERCTQAVFCTTEFVCQHWKDTSCTQSWLPPLISALTEQAALVQHAYASKKRTGTFNAAMGGKSCQ